jgi:Ca2+-binding EF-hand superfamily protein
MDLNQRSSVGVDELLTLSEEFGLGLSAEEAERMVSGWAKDTDLGIGLVEFTRLFNELNTKDHTSR